MTEPTAEQIAAERLKAYAIAASGYTLFGWGVQEMAFAQEAIATALARRAIEAHAAGRDEGLKLAVAMCHSKYCGEEEEHCSCTYELSERIRALRGRT